MPAYIDKIKERPRHQKSGAAYACEKDDVLCFAGSDQFRYVLQVGLLAVVFAREDRRHCHRMGSTFDAWRPAAAAYDIDQAERTDPAPEYRAANGRSEVYANASRHVLPIGKQLEQQRIQISVKLDRLEGNWVKHHEYILTTSVSLPGQRRAMNRQLII